MKIIGLTGPIGAGKDAVAKILKRRGAIVIDADKTAHGLYAFQSPVWRELLRTFGSKILVRGGEINRRKLGEIVFGDKKKLAVLNKIVHPYLKEEIIKKVESCQLSAISCKLLVITAAVLKEIGLVDYVDEIWLVTAPKETRLKRLIRKGLSKAEARQRLSFQPAQADYLKVADVIIKNNGTLRQLAKQVAVYGKNN